MQEELDGNLEGADSAEVVRLHVGGLGPAVIGSDILQTFSSHVHVSSVDVVRTKGRSFAYVTIQAAPHDIKRLFSLYNGCRWKGGCLKLEKAREFYMDKLRREWAECDCSQDLQKPKPDSETQARTAPNLKNSSGFNIYIPRLRKVKKIPEKGLGKHKRSFERMEPLPHSLLRLCNCDEECMTTCGYQSLPKQEPPQRATTKNPIHEAIPKSKRIDTNSGRKGKEVFEEQPRGWDERGIDDASDLDDLFLNIKGGRLNAEIDDDDDLDERGIDDTSHLDDLFMNIKGDRVIHKEETAKREVDGAIHAQRKRRKVEQDQIPSKGNRQHGKVDKGTDQTLQGEELIGSKYPKSATRSWVQKGSWKSLVGGAGEVSFSLGSVLKQG